MELRRDLDCGTKLTRQTNLPLFKATYLSHFSPFAWTAEITAMEGHVPCPSRAFELSSKWRVWRRQFVTLTVCLSPPLKLENSNLALEFRLSFKLAL